MSVTPAARRSRRLLLGWSATSVPVAPLLLVGVFLGPHGVAVLSESALAAVDPAMSVALAVLGILVGLEFSEPRAGAPHGVAPGGGLAVLTVALVGAGLFGAATRAPALATAPWLFALLCGICAASSLTLPGRSLPEPRRQTDALVEAEVAAAIAAGAAVLAYVRREAAAPAALLLAQNVGIAAVLGLAGWLLARRTTSTTERRVFVMATLLLVGGAADFLSSSPLFAGLCAGLLWQRLGGTSREVLQRETQYVQHPLLVLVLVVAGARTELSPLTLTLAAAYVSLRTVARFSGGALMYRFASATSRDLRFELVAPGVFGVAFALSVARAVATPAGDEPSVLSVVVAGTVGADVIARFVAAREVSP